VDAAVTRYCEASIARDIDGLLETLTPDAEVVSPLSGRMVFRGRGDLEVLLSAVYGSLGDWHWGEQLGDGDTRLVIGRGRVAGLPLDDAMVFELDADGRISRIRPHLRPWLGTTMFALILGPKVARHPGVIWRAVRG
jgi:SnoaL-like protein